MNFLRLFLGHKSTSDVHVFLAVCRFLLCSTQSAAVSTLAESQRSLKQLSMVVRDIRATHTLNHTAPKTCQSVGQNLTAITCDEDRRNPDDQHNHRHKLKSNDTTGVWLLAVGRWTLSVPPVQHQSCKTQNGNNPVKHKRDDGRRVG